MFLCINMFYINIFQKNNYKISRSQLSYRRKDLCRNLCFFSSFCEFFLFYKVPLSGRLLLKFTEYLFYEYLFSLDKSILFYRRWLMSNFFEILALVWAIFQAANDHQKFPLLGYESKNVPALSNMEKQPFADFLPNRCS